MERPHRDLSSGERGAIDAFVNRYMKSNSGKTKIQALQEYNREVANSKSKSPTHKSREANKKEVPFTVGETCGHHITQDELNNWISEKLKSEEDFEFSHINGLAYMFDGEFREKHGDAGYAHIIKISTTYNKNRAFVSCDQVMVSDNEGTISLQESAYDPHSIREFLGLEEDSNLEDVDDYEARIQRENEAGHFGRKEPDPPETYEIRPEQVKPLILYIITNLLSFGEDSIFLDYDTTLEIVQRRKVCRRLDTDVEEAAASIFHRYGLVDNAYNGVGIRTKKIKEIKQKYLKYTFNNNRM